MLDFGESEKWNSVTLPLLSVSTGPVPALSRSFVSNGQPIGIPRDPPTQTLTCSDDTFKNCKLPDSLGHCHPAQEEVTCMFKDNASYYMAKTSLLPQFVDGFWFTKEADSVIASALSGVV